MEKERVEEKCSRLSAEVAKLNKLLDEVNATRSNQMDQVSKLKRKLVDIENKHDGLENEIRAAEALLRERDEELSRLQEDLTVSKMEAGIVFEQKESQISELKKIISELPATPTTLTMCDTPAQNDPTSPTLDFLPRRVNSFAVSTPSNLQAYNFFNFTEDKREDKSTQTIDLELNQLRRNSERMDVVQMRQALEYINTSKNMAMERRNSVSARGSFSGVPPPINYSVLIKQKSKEFEDDSVFKAKRSRVLSKQYGQVSKITEEDPKEYENDEQSRSSEENESFESKVSELLEIKWIEPICVTLEVGSFRAMEDGLILSSFDEEVIPPMCKIDYQLCSKCNQKFYQSSHAKLQSQFHVEIELPKPTVSVKEDNTSLFGQGVDLPNQSDISIDNLVKQISKKRENSLLKKSPPNQSSFSSSPRPPAKSSPNYNSPTSKPLYNTVSPFNPTPKSSSLHPSKSPPKTRINSIIPIKSSRNPSPSNVPITTLANECFLIDRKCKDFIQCPQWH